MKFYSTFLFVFLFGSLFSFSQHSISGKVSDQNNSPLEFVNVILYNSETKAVVTGVISEDNGNYNFNDVATGKYYIEVSTLGYKTKTSEAFQLNTNKTLNFTLEDDSLDEVVIKAKKPVIRQTAEKLVVDLEQTAMVNTNLQDVIKKVPGMIVTNGNISYAGESGIRILINGKTTDYMDVSTLLRDMPADNIARVELVQQPGAEFDAEGTGPLLNIILKKNVKLGTHGNVKTNVGYSNDVLYGASASVASYINKLNWQASAGYRQSSWREDLTINRRINDEVYEQNSTLPEDPESYRFGAGIDYYANDNNSFGVSGNWFMSDSDRITENSTIIKSSTATNALYTNNSFDRERTNYNINPYYEYDNEKTKINLDFNYVNYDDSNINNLFEVGNNSTIAYDNRRYFQDSKYNIYTYKGDFKRIVSDKFTYSFGAKLANVNLDSDLKSLTQNTAGDFTLNEDQSNLFKIDESIFATYAKVNLSLDKWSFSGGLRWEDSNTKGTSSSNNETRDRKISKLFPSASISRKISEDLGVNLSYSYRIRRPSYSTLNSFVTYYDSYAFEQGNPNLKPAFTNSYKFSLTFDEQPFFNVSYRSTKDALFQVIQQNDTTGEIARTTINLAKRDTWSFSLFGPLDFLDNLDGHTGIQVNHNAFKSKNLATPLDLNKWSFTWFWNVEYKLPWDINTELSGYYTSGGLEGQVEYNDMALLDFAVSKTFLNDQLKVSVSWEEIINNTFSGNIQYDNLDANIKNDWVSNNIYLQLTYNFGSKFGKQKTKRNSSKDEENRIEDNN